MNPSQQTLEDKLLELETSSNIAEFEIGFKLEELRDTKIRQDACQEWQYELLAFSFQENYKDPENGWGTYFGPHSILPTNDGKMVQIPSIENVTEKTIEYWNTRAKKTKCAIFKARYLGLIWDFSEKLTKKKPDYSIAVLYCETLLEIARENTHPYSFDIIQKLERALNIAISLKKPVLVEEAKRTILNYDKSKNLQAHFWGFSFDLLIGHKKVDLSSNEEKQIINILEARLKKFRDPWSCEYAAKRLANYYQKETMQEEFLRVVKTWGNTFENAAKNRNAIASAALLEHIYHVYVRFHLKIDAKRIANMLQDLDSKLLDIMKPISVETCLDRGSIERAIEQVLEGSFEQVIERISLYYIPWHEQVKNQLFELAKQFPLSFLIESYITNSEGRYIAKIGSLLPSSSGNLDSGDLDGHIVQLMSRNMSIQSYFLSMTLEQAIEKFGLNSERILAYLFSSPVFRLSDKIILLKAIQTYLEEDYIVSIHLLVPQIEKILRNLVEEAGGAVLKARRNGGFHLKTLDELLRSEQIHQSLGEDVGLYFRVVLTDQRGWNIRNDVCHGILPQNQFTKSVADRLIHILLVLALLKPISKEEK